MKTTDYAGRYSCPKCGPYLDEQGNELETEWTNVHLVYPELVVIQGLEVPIDDYYIDDEDILHRAAHFLAGEFGVGVSVFYPAMQEVIVESRDWKYQASRAPL
jgi:cbb3-type cytochrome oxidase cytochrome c subunit